jgi:uncharacterized protein YcgI (DUF1989 family)
LRGAIAAFGLPPDAVHDPLNLFMTTAVGAKGRSFYIHPTAKRGDFVELYAELSCLVAISACPGASSGPENRPLGIEVFSSEVTW